MSQPNCPFYGYMAFRNAAAPIPILLWATGGNQCALIPEGSPAPCLFDIDREPVEWRDCPRVKDIRVGEKR